MKFNKVKVSDILDYVEFDIVWSPEENAYVKYDEQTNEIKDYGISEDRQEVLDSILDYVANDYFLGWLDGSLYGIDFYKEYPELYDIDTYEEYAKWMQKHYNDFEDNYRPYSKWNIDVVYALDHPENLIWDFGDEGAHNLNLFDGTYVRHSDRREYAEENNDWKMTEDMEVNAFKETMLNSIPHQNDGCVGIFWYDVNNNELFGVDNPLVVACQEYKSNLFNNPVRTTPKLHVDVWNKQAKKGKDHRFQGDYTLIPRGRVFCETLEDGSLLFKIMVGNWIIDYPEAKDLIIEEFDLQDKNYEFKTDEHWDIGHGYSDELL